MRGITAAKTATTMPIATATLTTRRTRGARACMEPFPGPAVIRPRFARSTLPRGTFPPGTRVTPSSMGISIPVEAPTRGVPATDVAHWLLTSDERGNPDTRLDQRRGDGRAWTEGNLVGPVMHGMGYFSELVDRAAELGRGDRFCFTDWRGDSDQT